LVGMLRDIKEHKLLCPSNGYSRCSRESSVFVPKKDTSMRASHSCRFHGPGEVSQR
jgi:hypothetical protein